jgi:polysaccharide export outer membrane protein
MKLCSWPFLRSRGFHARACSALVLASAMFMVPTPAAAQFNGPGAQNSSALNMPQTPTTDPAILYPAAREVTLTDGDILTVRVLGPGDYAATVRVGADGRIQLPLIGSIAVEGLAVAAAEQLVAKDLSDGQFFVDPQVLLTLVEGPNAGVSIVGEMHAVVPIAGQRRLLEVLAAAGSLPPTASHVLTIDRPGVAQPIVVDLGSDPARSSLANIPVFPGDTIVVSRVGGIYVLGAFKSQGLVPLNGNTPVTLLQAAALSGGPLYQAEMKDLRIIRTTGNKRSLVRVNYTRVLYGRDPDPILQADDILFLPTNSLKSAIANGGVGIIFSAASLLVSIVTLQRVQ